MEQNNTFGNLLGGMVGAITLNLLHQGAAAIYDDAPRVDLVGEEALNKGLKQVGLSPLKGDKLFSATLAGDVVTNAVYYSMIGVGNKKYLLARGAGFGLMAGIGALTLPEPMGLDDAPVNRTTATKALTLAWYLLGGLATACTLRILRRNQL